MKLSAMPRNWYMPFAFAYGAWLLLLAYLAWPSIAGMFDGEWRLMFSKFQHLPLYGIPGIFAAMGASILLLFLSLIYKNRDDLDLRLLPFPGAALVFLLVGRQVPHDVISRVALMICGGLTLFAAVVGGAVLTLGFLFAPFLTSKPPPKKEGKPSANPPMPSAPARALPRSQAKAGEVPALRGPDTKALPAAARDTRRH